MSQEGIPKPKWDTEALKKMGHPVPAEGEKRDGTFDKALNLSYLYGQLGQMKEIRGSHETYSASDLIKVIESVRLEEDPVIKRKLLQQVTRTHGLRYAVARILGIN